MVTLNEECGFIQWVPNTIPMRFPLLDGLSARGIAQWVGRILFQARYCMSDLHVQGNKVQTVYEKLSTMRDKEAAELFRKEIMPR